MGSVRQTAETAQLREQLVHLDTGLINLPVFEVGPNDNGRYPGLILVHEIFGLNRHIKKLARRFASQSMHVYAPDLFQGRANLPADRSDLQAMREVWQSIPDGDIIYNLRAVLSMARSSEKVQHDRIGTIGYCMGGAIALMFAAESAELSFVVDYYGRVLYPEISPTKPKHPIDYAPGLACPVLGIFAGRDELISRAEVELFEGRLKQLNKNVRLKVFADAPHAFFNDEREHYHKESAEEAWKMTIDFMKAASNTPLDGMK